jgi:hypothetical protein
MVGRDSRSLGSHLLTRDRDPRGEEGEAMRERRGRRVERNRRDERAQKLKQVRRRIGERAADAVRRSRRRP